MRPPAREATPTAERARVARRLAVIITVGLSLAVVGTVAVVALSTQQPVDTLAPLATDARNTLDRAAAALGFRPTPSTGVGLVEAMAADTYTGEESPTLLAVGTLTPGFTLAGPTGETVSLAEYRGRTVLLEFFATWCPHCQAEAPHLVRMHARLDPERFAIVSVNANSEDAVSVHAYDRYYGIPFPTLLDPGGTPGNYNKPGGAGTVTRAYGIAVFPTFYVIGPDGRVAWRADGEQPNALIVREMENAASR